MSMKLSIVLSLFTANLMHPYMQPNEQNIGKEAMQSILPGGCVRTMQIEQEPSIEQETSSVSELLTQIKAIREAMAFVSINDASRLVTCNDAQKAFIDRYVLKSDTLLSLFPQELQARASDDIPALNAWLRQEEFDIQLSEDIPDTFGVVAMLKVALEWKQKAKQAEIEHNGQRYNAFELEDKHDCDVFYVDDYAHPIARVVTTNNDAVYFALADEAVQDEQLQDKVVMLLAQNKTSSAPHDSIIVPKVSLNIQKTLTKLIGLRIGNNEIVEAEQQTKFSMDENGAHVASATAMLVKRCCAAYPAYEMNKPFYVWIQRGKEQPYFAAYITPQDWQKQS